MAGWHLLGASDEPPLPHPTVEAAASRPLTFRPPSAWDLGARWLAAAVILLMKSLALDSPMFLFLPARGLPLDMSTTCLPVKESDAAPHCERRATERDCPPVMHAASPTLVVDEEGSVSAEKTSLPSMFSAPATLPFPSSTFPFLAPVFPEFGEFETPFCEGLLVCGTELDDDGFGFF